MTHGKSVVVPVERWNDVVTPEIMTDDELEAAWRAPGEETGWFATMWQNKPHRLIYTLLGHIRATQEAAPAPSSLAGGEVWNPYQITPNDIAAILDENADCSDHGGGLLNASQLARKIWDAGLAALSPEAPAREGVESFDNVEVRAEAWSDRAEIQRMVEATTGVFAKWSSPEILSRFRQQFMAVVQQAYIEGYDAALTPRHEAPASEGDAS